MLVIHDAQKYAEASDEIYGVALHQTRDEGIHSAHKHDSVCVVQ